MRFFRRKSPLKGFLAGALGGLVGTLALDLFKQGLEKGTRAAADAAEVNPTLAQQQARQTLNYHQAHAETAEQLALAVGTNLTPHQKLIATPLTHYAFGALCGGVYGLLAEYQPGTTFGAGTAFGTSLFVVTNEAVLPVLRLLPHALATPAINHAEGILSHALYGATTEAIRKLIR